MRVLLTGAAGRIGRVIHARLKERGHEVLGIDLVDGPTTDVVMSAGDRDALPGVLRGCGAVVHTAALHAPHVGIRTDAEFQALNVAATAALFEQARAAGANRFVFTSTTALYGVDASTARRAAWVDEDTVPEPRTIYHRTKLAAEQLLSTLARGDMAISILRMSRCFPEPLPLMAAYRLHRGVDARDVAEAHLAALEWTGPGVRRHLISARTPFAREDAAELFADAPAVLKRKAPSLVAAFAARGWALPASIDRVYDSSRARAELRWEPRYGFEAVLA